MLQKSLALLICAFLISSPLISHGKTGVVRNAGTLSLENLSCDGSADPLGVDNPLPRFHWSLRAPDEQVRAVAQTGYQILVASSHTYLDRDHGDVWDSGKTSGALAPAVPFAGNQLESDTVYYWKARVWDEHGNRSAWSRAGMFLTGQMQSSDWRAKWIAASPDGPPPTQTLETNDMLVASVPPLPVFRALFSVTKTVARATLFISGLGEAETFINGNPVTKAVLTPGWTDYRKTVLYDTYDVTSLLHSGSNAIGVMLGNGMYHVDGMQGRYTKFIGSFGQPKLIAEIHIHYADGSVSTFASGPGWKTTSGPILFSSIYGGEDYDARRLSSNWAQASFQDGGWKPAIVVSGAGGQLRAERLPPVKVAEVLKPIRVTRVSSKVSVYDLGRNIAGRPDFTVSGPAGATVRILPGELLDASHRVSQTSEAASPKSPVLFNYTLRGTGDEHWAPQFSYSGFRYAEVSLSGDAGLPVVRNLASEAMHDAAERDGSFASSDTLLNRIHKLIDTAIENNMVSILTDCPTREKLGWLEQTHLAGPSILYNYDLSLLYRKMARDMRDSELSDGMVPAIAPEFVAFVDSSGHSTNFRDSPEWGSAIILSPWTDYSVYGDTGILRENYAAMVAYATYLQSRAEDNMLSYGLGDWYDIGPGAPGSSQLTGQGMTATAIYYQDLTALARIASILGKSEDAVRFSGQAEAVKASLNAHLFHAESDSYDRGSQTANAMALALGMVPDGHRDGVLNNLVADIRKHENHVTAGDIGFHYVVRALTDNGRSDVLYEMLMRTDSPSYGYQLKHGATSLTEAWDANPHSSQDHFMLGHAEEWFYRGLGGIDFDFDRAPDKRIWIHPQVAGSIRFASVSYKSVLGAIASHWQRNGNALHLDVVIPAGNTATISFPTGFDKGVTESGQSLREGKGVLSVSEQGEPLSCVVGSGHYHFDARR